MESKKPYLVFFVFKSVSVEQPYYLSVKRGDYFGFPGGPLDGSDDVLDYAMRTLKPIALIKTIGHLFKIRGGPCTWDEQPATFDLFFLPDADMIAPINSDATHINPEKDSPVDVFVEFFINRNIKHIEFSRAESAA